MAAAARAPPACRSQLAGGSAGMTPDQPSPIAGWLTRHEQRGWVEYGKSWAWTLISSTRSHVEGPDPIEQSVDVKIRLVAVHRVAHVGERAILDRHAGGPQEILYALRLLVGHG